MKKCRFTEEQIIALNINLTIGVGQTKRGLFNDGKRKAD
jgi:hypothetical protein